MTSTLSGSDAIPSPSRPAAALRRVGRLGRALWRGREADAVWVRPAFLGLLLLAAVLDVWDLAASGWANAFYSAAAQAGASNWEAFLYGSSDAGNSITVDKPPASLWVMALSVRIFGLSAWSILLPEALMGIATVALVYLIVRRRFAPGAALIAGLATAVTPVAVLMFRFDNPDALLVLLVTLATYLTLRGIEDGRVRWILWAGVAVGVGFLTKQLQAFLVVPVLGGVYLFSAPRRVGIRLAHLAGALGTLVASAGWWVALVELVPASMRPYIGGSQTNDFLELTFGYNDFGRLTGQETGSVTGGGAATGGGMWGRTGLLRLFGGDFASQISWLLPAALGLLVIGVVVTWRRPRTDASRALVLLLGGTLVVTGLAFSFGAGIIHPYYSVALAPAIGGLVGVGSALLWQRRAALWARIAAAALVLASTAWAVVLLSAAQGFLPWLPPVVGAAGLLGAAALLLPPRLAAAAPVAIAVSLVAVLAGPAAFAVNTTLTPHSGSLPTAGPAVSLGSTGGPGGTGAGVGQGFGGGTGFTPPAGGFGARNGFAPPTGGFGGRAGFGGGTNGGFGGGLLGGNTSVDAAVTEALKAGASSYTWAAAAIGSQNAASYQLATGLAVMPIGGFNGSDPSPTLAEFEQDVAAGRIHWFIASGMRGGVSNGGSNASAEIAAWVEENFIPQTVGGTTLYDLSPSATS
ncbi:MAG TPA: glycosyltransferase family 39 protein [Amnibacterium sp.]|nr:glycosyltransferase family 39 protein [Amnibacterium sp.]